MAIDPRQLLDNIPEEFRDPLFAAIRSIEKNYREKRWEPAELNGGKLCEAVYCILKGHVDGKFPPKPRKPTNMLVACKNLEQADKTAFPRSVRIQIPRMLIALYEIRNSRGVGHIGGDVDPNHMDATVVVTMAKWVFADLIRLFHGVSTEEASAAVDSIIEREIPLVWDVGGKKRILDPTLPMKSKMLILAYSCLGSVKDTELFEWTEHSNLSVFRRGVLTSAHRAKLIEYDTQKKEVLISPLGIKFVEGPGV